MRVRQQDPAGLGRGHVCATQSHSPLQKVNIWDVLDKEGWGGGETAMTRTSKGEAILHGASKRFEFKMMMVAMSVLQGLAYQQSGDKIRSAV